MKKELDEIRKRLDDSSVKAFGSQSQLARFVVGASADIDRLLKVVEVMQKALEEYEDCGGIVAEKTLADCEAILKAVKGWKK